MEFIEKDLESIIWDNSQTKEGREKLYNRGLNIMGKLFRQVYIGGYGIADLLSVEIKKGRWGDECIVTIYELKKDMINIDTLTQAFRYHTGIKSFFDARYGEFKDCPDLTINVVLIGKTIEAKSDFVFLLNTLIDDCVVHVYTYNYNIDGLFFEEECGGWYRPQEKFDSVDFDIAGMSVEDKKQILGSLNTKE
jgi:hypothetical protein